MTSPVTYSQQQDLGALLDEKLENLKKDLIVKKNLKELRANLKEKIKNELLEIFQEQDKNIAKLLSTVLMLQEQIIELKKQNKLMSADIDDNEQYRT